jgi:hypothetical protein
VRISHHTRYRPGTHRATIHTRSEEAGRGVNARSKKWVIRIAGPAERPVVVLRMSAPTFARVSAGILAPITAVLERKVEVDLRLVNRLAEMLGGPSDY